MRWDNIEHNMDKQDQVAAMDKTVVVVTDREAAVPVAGNMEEAVSATWAAEAAHKKSFSFFYYFFSST